MAEAEAAPVQKFQVPREFPSVLKAFTREILRSQPSDVYQFGVDYFNEILEQQAEAQREAASSRRLTVEELEIMLRQMFEEADTDGSGSLDLNEFKNLMNMAELPLSKKEMRAVMAEADVNNDGEVNYAEFLPLAIEIVQGLYAREDLRASEEAEEEEAREAAQDMLVHGMSREELQQMMKAIFEKADKDESGALDRQEFKTCMQEAELGLTKKEINILMQQVDVDGDGQITWDEFVPVCFDILVEIMKDEVIKAKPPDELEAYLVDAFGACDTDNSGMLPSDTVRDVIRKCDMGLSLVQIHTIMAEADEDENSLIHYPSFAPAVAKLAYQLLS